MATLSEYMERHGLSDEDMADKVRKSRTRISKIRRGIENPSLELALEIERVTGGDVRPADLFRRQSDAERGEAA